MHRNDRKPRNGSPPDNVVPTLRSHPGSALDMIIFCTETMLVLCNFQIYEDTRGYVLRYSWIETVCIYIMYLTMYIYITVQLTKLRLHSRIVTPILTI